MLCLIVILSSGRVCCRGPVPEHFGTGEPDHQLLGAVTDRLAFPVVWLEDVSSNGRHFALKKKEKKFSLNPFQRKTNLIFWKANRHLAEWMKLKQMMSVEHKMIHPRWMDVRRSWNGTGHFDGGCLFLFKISINLMGASWIIFRRLVRHFPPFSTDLQKYQFQSNLLFV